MVVSILRNFFQNNFSYKVVWLVVIFSILLSIIGTRYELAGGDLRNHPYIGILLTPFDHVRYGHYIARKFFLVVIAFLVFGYWLTTQRELLLRIKSNLKYIIIIGVSLFSSRILTYGFWFYNDDTRFFQYHLFAPTQPNYNPQGVWGPIGSHPIAIFLLVIRWFETNYSLYNTLGLFFYFLAGIVIFVLTNKLQNSKFVSLVAAVFFLTTPTYFQGRLLIGEIINSPFILSLVILSIYFLLQRFIPGALIFTAAALEYGIAKTYFIALPLTLFTIFFTGFTSNLSRAFIQKKALIFFLVALLLISLVYIPAFSIAPAAGSVGKIITFDKLIVFGDVLLAVTLQHSLSQPLVKYISLMLNQWIYTSASFGFLMIFNFAMVGLIAFFRGKKSAAKLITIGLSIIIPSAAIGSLMGVRVDRNVQKLVEYVINDPIPIGATAYGILPALGLTFILIGIGCLLKPKVFKIFALVLILINIFSSFLYDYRWLESPYAYPQRRYDEQLQQILPRDGIAKYVYVPPKERPFYQSVVTFGSIYQGDQKLYTYMDSDEFVSDLKRNSPPADHLYFLITSGKPKYKIYDYSNKIRNISYNKLEASLQSLTIELTPNHPEF